VKTSHRNRGPRSPKESRFAFDVAIWAPRHRPEGQAFHIPREHANACNRSFPTAPICRIVAAMQHRGSPTVCCPNEHTTRRQCWSLNRYRNSRVSLKVEPDNLMRLLLSRVTDAVDRVVRDNISAQHLAFSPCQICRVRPDWVGRLCIRECRGAINDKKWGGRDG